MRRAICTLKAISPYSQSRRMAPKEDKEDWDAWEQRCWRTRLHVNENGHVFIPPMAFKRSVERAASYLRMRIPGKGQSEYGKHFLSGVLVVQGLELPITPENCKSEDLLLSSKGKKGEMDVLKTMPLIPAWEGKVEFYVLDDIIPNAVFEKTLQEAGNFIGIGRFRPEKGGYYGRYKVTNVEWIDDRQSEEMAAA